MEFSVQTGITANYSHGYPVDLKRRLLEEWADHVEKLVQPQGAALLRLRKTDNAAKNAAPGARGRHPSGSE